jgi:hypothetical protein
MFSNYTKRIGLIKAKQQISLNTRSFTFGARHKMKLELLRLVWRLAPAE